MRFDILSIFPASLTSYFQASILKRAQEAGLITIATHDVRAFATDKHQKVDDTPYGGGAGMVMMVEPFDRALQSMVAVRGTPGTHIILLSAKGRPFDQVKARELAQYDRLVLLAGRYEGVDERVAEHLVDEELSIGPFVLTGGELGAMVVVDAVARLLPGVLGNDESTVAESFSEGVALEHPQYTKPEVYRDWTVPPVLLSGHHAEIEAWRNEQSLRQTNKRYDQEIPLGPVSK
ncbi:MAG: tRNA (guanosine(37)-N1)-methyltransferase TrmD [Candidatus Moraniibacteriota bacterium]